MAGKHHCLAVIPVPPNPSCFTQVNSFVPHGCPLAGLSIHPLQGETLDHACYRSFRCQHGGSSKMGEELFTGASVDPIYCTL